MTLTGEQLGAFADLATAIGLLRDGETNATWFSDPVGQTGNDGQPFRAGLRTMLADDAQREALVSFVDEMLGPPERESVDDEIWVPLFDESDPNITIYVVLTPRPGSVRLGVGFEYETGTATPRVAMRLHVPMFQMERRGGTLEPGDTSTPDWLLLGGPNGNVAITVDATLSDAPPPAGTAGLGGLALTLSLPTSVEGTVSFAVTLQQLQLPGASGPQDFALRVDELDEIGAEVLDLLLGLIRAQADALDLTDPALRPFAALTGMLGIRSVPGVPPFPLADLATLGVDTVVSWIRDVLATDASRDAWLAELADVLGATADAANDAVRFTIGPTEVLVGIRIEPGVTGLPVLIPWIELGTDTGGGARGRLEASADLLRLDTGTGVASALPTLRAEAVLGVDAGGPPLLSGDPGVGSLRIGIALADASRAAFTFALGDVVLNGRPHDVVDLSSPDAAIDAANDLIDGAIVAALDGLGPPGALIAQIVGLDPPAGIAGTDATALLADPLGELSAYWDDLVGASDAMRAVLARVQELITGAAVTLVPGAGTGTDPWTVALAGPVELLLWLDAGALRCALAVSTAVSVLGDHEVVTAIRAELARVRTGDLSADFATGASATLRVRRADTEPITIDLPDVSIVADHVEVGVEWRAASGLRVALDAPGLAIRTGPTEALPPIDVSIPLPRFDATGNLVFEPDWEDVEQAITALLGRFDSPIVRALLDLAGWTSDGPRLSLTALISDPDTAMSAWLADLVLDCGRVRAALTPIAALCSGFRGELEGIGTRERPFRCPVGGDRRAPGLAVWLDPGCRPPVGPVAFDTRRLRSPVPLDVQEVVAVLHEGGLTLADVGDLLVGRDGLAEGLALLRDRWTGTDGLVAAPAPLPEGVTDAVIADASYHDLVALGASGALAFDVFDPVPTAVVHVGCEATWTAGRPAGTTFNTVAGTNATIPATGDGVWFVRLPDPADAAAARPDRGAVGEQAARLAAVLAGRTDPVAVVAYGAAGAAALRVAVDVTAIDRLATVGVPWGPLSLDTFATGLGGDALRLLDLLRARPATGDTSDVADLEADPTRRISRIVERSVAALDPERLPPPATAETLRAGLPVVAAFGSLGTDELELGIAGAVADGLDARLAAQRAADLGPETALHAGVGVPAFDLDLAGLLVGAGVTLQLCTVSRATDGALAVDLDRAVLLELHFGVHDGWLVGGPGAAQHDLELRWLSALVDVPLDGGPGRTTLILHEATTFGVHRERWVVGPSDAAAGADTAVSMVVPEVRALLSQVAGRLGAEAPAVATALERLGVMREGGLDPAGLDRWVYDTTRAARDAIAADAAELATALRALVGDAASTGAALAWTVGPTSLGVDFATGTIAAAAAMAADGAAPAIDVTLAASPAGADVTAAVGAIDADRGGLRLVASGGTTSGPALFVEAAAAGAAPERVGLFPIADPSGLARLAAAAVPAGIASRLVDRLRVQASPAGAAALDSALDLLGLLGDLAPNGVRQAVVPTAVFLDPGGWLRHGASAWRSAFAPSAVAFLDLVAELVVGAPATSGLWQVTPELAVRYEALPTGRLRLRARYADSLTAGTATVETAVSAGLDVAIDAPPSPVLDASVAVDGHGVRLAVDPGIRLDLVRPAPRPAVALYPAGSGIGDIASAAGGMVAPIVLNALIAHRDDPGSSLTIDAARVAYDLGAALDLLEADQFTGPRIEAFAADPAAALVARLPQVAAGGIARLAAALDPAGALVTLTAPAAGRAQLALGASDSVTVMLDASGPAPAVELGLDVAVPGIGRVVVERIRLSAAGVQVAARIGPAPIDLGPLTLLPLVVVRAGVSGAGFTRAVGIGLATDASAAASVEFRWSLDASPPSLVVVSRTAGAEALVDDPAAAGLQLAGAAASIAAGILVNELDTLLTDAVTGWLQGVVFTDVPGSVTVDAAVFTDVLDPEALLDRVLRLAWNVATVSPPALTIDDKLEIKLVANGPASNRRLGLNLTLEPNERFTLASGDTQVELEVDAGWIDAEADPGLTIELLRGSVSSLAFAPAVVVGGIGVRIAKSSGPILDLGGVAIDAIAIHTYAEATSTGQLGGGVQLQLDGFAFSPAAGGGDNAVANSLMNDAGAAGAANRPAFSPAFSVLLHPGASGPSVGFRAGDPPGPWWVVVQRQLGPIYIEQVGLDTVEANGAITRISLLFDGRVSLFGLDAAVEQLSLNWHGGDPLTITSWSVDLKGLAVSADLSGAYLAGGLLKTDTGGQIGYVGMLMGRFGVYGLSVFGGYTDDNGSPSFFVFGAFNGPIGGPPAFFLTGIGGGLGINRALNTPSDLSRFDQYPFIKALDPAAQPSGDPMGELLALNLYFPPERGNFWFAAGISFTCFSLIDGVAVVAVSFGNGFELNLLGLARLALPRPQVALVSIELGLLVRFSTSEGLFLMQAQLTDNSWLLYEEVRLTGGFAMAMWWKGALTGQFVVSLGGYHPSFHRDGYPIVPRLGLEWRISDEIVVKGGAYFALTSEALMAGVDVELSANFGWAWVRVAFGAHAIVFFDPFYYQAEAYARISAGVRVKIWFATVSFSISIGARIMVEGPDFSGRASFEVGPCELSVGFGSSRKERTPVLLWPEFIAKYLEDAGADQAKALSGITGRGTLPAATGGEVGAPSSDGSADRPFEVFAEFEISFVTSIPTTTFVVGANSVSVTPRLPDNTTTGLGVAPMGIEHVTPTVTIRLQRRQNGAYADVPAATLNALGAGLRVSSAEEATPHVRTDSFPLGVWGPPGDENNKPMPSGDVVRAGHQIKLVAGISTATAGPEIDYRQVTAGRRPLPLLADETARTELLDTAAAVPVDAPTTAADALAAARGVLFGELPAAAEAAAGVLPRGEHSVLAATAFAGDRVAPPRFGTLAGGIRATNGERATTERRAPPQPGEGRPIRHPTVIGLLASGSGVLAAPRATTVSNARIKRRLAPSVDSVRGRLGDELPIRLDRPAPPALDAEGTLLVRSYPRTDLAGATASHVGARRGSAHLDGLVAGLAAGGAGPLDTDGSPPIRSGDIVVLEQIDAAIDVDDRRPRLRIDGAARVVMLRADGTAAVDRELRDGSVDVPPRVRLLAVQADGELDVSDGLSGWHARSRLGRVGARTAIGPGCTVTADGADATRRTGWVGGRDLVTGALGVTTHFARPADFVVLVLDGGSRLETLPMGVELRGARRSTDAAGAEVPPTVVLAGGQSLVLLPIEVTDPAEGFDVVVHAGGEWRLGGVLAGRGDLRAVADVLASRGVDATAAKLLAVAGPGCRISWEDAPGPVKKAASKRATPAKKTTAKKTTTKKATAKKTTARKRGGR